MKKIHIIIAALIVAIATMIGGYALTSTLRLGLKSQVSASQASNLNVSQTTKRLSATEAALRSALAKSPPNVSKGQRVPFVAPQKIIVNVSGSASAVPITTIAPTHSFQGEGLDD